MAKKSKGGFPPIITVILFIIMIAVSVLVGWWFISVHSKAIARPVLSLSGGLYISGNKAYFTVVNDGTVDYSGTVSLVSSYASGSADITVPAGGSASVQMTVTWTGGSPPSDKTSFDAVLQFEGAGEIRAVAEILRG